MKKLIGLLLALGLMSTLFVACSTDEETQTVSTDFSQYICMNIDEALEDLGYTMDDNAEPTMAYTFAISDAENYLDYDFNVKITYESTDEQLVSSYVYYTTFDDITEAIDVMQSVYEQLEVLYGDSYYYNVSTSQIKDVTDPVSELENGNSYYAIWGLADYGFSEIEEDCNENLEQVLFDDTYDMTFVVLTMLTPSTDGTSYTLEISFMPAQVTLSDTQIFY